MLGSSVFFSLKLRLWGHCFLKGTNAERKPRAGFVSGAAIARDGSSFDDDL